MNCYSCASSNLPGTIFCLDCGTSLLPTERKRDTTARLGRTASARALPKVLGAAALPSAEARQLRATVLASDRRVELPLATPVLIGRQDTERDCFPDLDLNNDGGYDSGVSRKHARIVLSGSSVFVEDLHSANGTFLNGQRVAPGHPRQLRAADELRLGSLFLRIDHV